MTDTTIERVREVLKAEGYDDAAEYLKHWAFLPADLRAVHPPPVAAQRAPARNERVTR